MTDRPHDIGTEQKEEENGAQAAPPRPPTSTDSRLFLALSTLLYSAGGGDGWSPVSW